MELFDGTPGLGEVVGISQDDEMIATLHLVCHKKKTHIFLGT